MLFTKLLVEPDPKYALDKQQDSSKQEDKKRDFIKKIVRDFIYGTDILKT